MLFSVNDDPRIELPEVWVGIRTRSLGNSRIRGERTGDRRGADAHDEQTRALQEGPLGGGPIPL